MTGTAEHFQAPARVEFDPAHCGYSYEGRKMRRIDRMSRIVQHMRGGRLVTARMLGETLAVSDRTIYRDIAALQSSGVRIDGEAGVGYLLRGERR